MTAPDGGKILDFVMPETADGLSGLGLNPVNSHTIRGRGEVRTCVECHRSPPSLGLGSGNYAVARDLAFTAADCGVLVFDRKGNPAGPPLLGVIPTGAPAKAMATLPNIVQGTTDYLYVAAGTAGVSIFNLQEGIPSVPVAQITGINAIDVRRIARYLYVVAADEGVRIYDNAAPADAVYVATVPLAGALRAVPWGIHLFVPAGDDGLIVVDVADHTAPQIVGSANGIRAEDVALYAHFQDGPDFAARAYVTDAAYGVHVLDLLPDFTTPRLVRSIPLAGASGLDTYTRYLPASGGVPSREHDYLYVAGGAAGRFVYDITRPEAMLEVASLTSLGGFAAEVDVVSQLAQPGVDDCALIANTLSGLQVVDVTDPLTPTLREAGSTCGASHVLTEVQQLDRFLDEQGHPLKANSHPGVTTLRRADIVRILRASVIASQTGIPDLDGDTDADLFDHRRLYQCLRGPGATVEPGCGYADFDSSGHVDLRDVAHFQAGFDGS